MTLVTLLALLVFASSWYVLPPPPPDEPPVKKANMKLTSGIMDKAAKRSSQKKKLRK